MSVDIAGFVSDLKEHATEHGFHVHDERHFIETYSLRQSWEVDVHPEAGCGGPIDLHLALDVDPKVILALRERLDQMGDEFQEPENEYYLDLFFNWSVEVAAIDSYGAVTDAPDRRLTLTGKSRVSLVDVLMGREQLCDALDRSREVSEYLLDRVGDWLELPG